VTALEDSVVWRRSHAAGALREIVAGFMDESIRGTPGRVIRASASALLSARALFPWGGTGLHDFTPAIFVGIAADCFSAVFIASPMILWLFQRERIAVCSMIQPAR